MQVIYDSLLQLVQHSSKENRARPGGGVFIVL